MNQIQKLLLGALVASLSTQAVAQVTFYKDEGFRGSVFSAHTPIDNFSRAGFNDRGNDDR